MEQWIKWKSSQKLIITTYRSLHLIRNTSQKKNPIYMERYFFLVISETFFESVAKCPQKKNQILPLIHCLRNISTFKVLASTAIFGRETSTFIFVLFWPIKHHLPCTLGSLKTATGFTNPSIPYPWNKIFFQLRWLRWSS